MAIRQAAAVFAVTALFACSGSSGSDDGGTGGGTAAGGGTTAAGGGTTAAGGGTTAAGGGTTAAGGGTTAAGGGTTAAGGGTTAAGGGTTAAGGGTAANPCDTATYDAVLGTLALQNGAHVVSSVALGFDVFQASELNGVQYTLGYDGVVKQLDAGTVVGNVVDPLDRDGGAYPSYFLTGTDHYLLGGYTQAPVTGHPGIYPGKVAVIDLNGAATRYITAPNNFSAIGFTDGFALNGGGFTDGVSTDAIYLVDTKDGGTSTLATFGATFEAVSSFNAVTTDQVLLFGYLDTGASFNHLRAAAPLQYSPAVQTGVPFDLTNTVDVASVTDFLFFGSIGTSAVVVHGGFMAVAPFADYATKIERVPLTVSGSTVTKGTAITMATSSDQCTSVSFTATSGADLLLGISDKNGARLVRIAE